MSKRLSLFAIFFASHFLASGQTDRSISTMISLIKSVPFHYTSSSQKDIKKLAILNKLNDASFQMIVSYDTVAIPYLINKLNDTTLTEIYNSCSKNNFKIGDIAFLLINDIEQIPYSTVTNTQWCLVGQCGKLPDYFFNYLELNRLEFQLKYRKYYYSIKRQEFLKHEQSRANN